MKIIIPRDQWGRGSEGGYYLKANGDRCAVGFVLQACGVADTWLLGNGSITELPLHITATLPHDLVQGDSDLHLEASDALLEVTVINDEFHYDDTLREHNLTNMLSLLGFDITFVNSLETSHAHERELVAQL